MPFVEASQCPRCHGKGKYLMLGDAHRSEGIVPCDHWVSEPRMPAPQPKMTLGAVNTTVGLVLRELRLGQGSFGRGAAFEDYVSMEFAILNPTKEHADAIERHFRVLTERYSGWAIRGPAVSPKRNVVAIAIEREGSNRSSAGMGL